MHDTLEPRLTTLSAKGQSNLFFLITITVIQFSVALSISDADLIDTSRTRGLPTFGVEVPVLIFFTLSSLIATLAYIHLHIIIVKYIDCLAEYTDTNSSEDFTPILQKTKSWIIGEILLSKPDSNPEQRALSILLVLGSISIVWLLLPCALALIWTQTLAAHSLVFSALLSLFMSVSLAIGWISGWKLACARADTQDLERTVVSVFVSAFICIVLLIYSNFLTSTGLPSTQHRQLATANFENVRFSTLSPDIFGTETSFAQFRSNWCDDRVFGSDDCTIFVRATSSRQLDDLKCAKLKSQNERDRCFAEIDRNIASFFRGWRFSRQSQLESIDKPSFANSQYSGSSFARAHLLGMDFSNANLTGSNFSNVFAEGSDFSGATLREVNLRQADLTRARLSSADLSGADLAFADLTNALLNNSSFGQVANEVARQEPLYFGDQTNLSGALLDGAVLSHSTIVGYAHDIGFSARGADLRGSEIEFNLRHSDLSYSLVFDTDLRRATGLTQRMLSTMVGDATTLLPLELEDGSVPYVCSCLNRSSSTISGFAFEFNYFNSDGVSVGQAPWRKGDEWFCKDGEIPLRTGTPLGENEAYPWASFDKMVSPVARGVAINKWAVDQLSVSPTPCSS